jgi:hypothetical protein
VAIGDDSGVANQEPCAHDLEERGLHIALILHERDGQVPNRANPISHLSEDVSIDHCLTFNVTVSAGRISGYLAGVGEAAVTKTFVFEPLFLHFLKSAK